MIVDDLFLLTDKFKLDANFQNEIQLLQNVVKIRDFFMSMVNREPHLKQKHE